ncbi:dihydrolipoyl dehydrogenase [Haloglomus litoreum]|uniref:dihydrolipoyl dehydrogenase n=1 Tax=Haloglomus litoreum TaxID=3034026 RepID=UPI0023E89B99|nr:dihydrolipoyl dehydrogenase [Haloglomus sp. DT116]
MAGERQETELLVVGAGPGGYAAAIKAAQNGVETTLADRDAVGGTCLNYGCIPSKALLTATGRLEAMRNAERMGIQATASADTEAMVAWKDEVVDGLTNGIGGLCRANGVSIREGHVTFVDETTGIIDGPDGERELSFDAAIVATGSRPITVPNFEFDGERILDSRGMLSVSEVPDRLLVIGAGYIGMELSTVFARLGADVTVIEMLDEALAAYDDDLSRPVVKQLRSLGVSFRFGEAALDWRENGDDITVFTETEGGEMNEYQGDRALVAVGRAPVTDGLGLDALGLSTTERGFIETDERGATDVANVYAVGDVAGEPMLAHKATHEGLVAAETIAGMDTATAEQPVPAVVFTDPEIGTVGRTEQEAIDAGYNPVVGEFPFTASGRALTRNATDGFVRLVGDAATGEILGCQMVGEEVAELLGEVGVAMRGGLTLDELAGTVHAHPTLSEAVMEAAADALDEAVHI